MNEILQENYKYIVIYIILGFIHFLWCYGLSFREIYKFNKISSNKASIKWSELIFLKGIFWPIGFIMDIVKSISLIGV